MFCSSGWWMEVPQEVSAGVSPALGDVLMAGLGNWSFLSSKQVSKDVLPVYLEMSILLRCRCGSREWAQRKSVERRNTFPQRGAWLTRWLPFSELVAGSPAPRGLFFSSTFNRSTGTRSLTHCITEISPLQVLRVPFADQPQALLSHYHLSYS